MKKLVLASIVVATSLVSLSAFAQTDAKKSKSQPVESWEFPDDKLLSVKGGNDGMVIGPGHITVRTIITRPRTHFVPELLKTIESL